MKAERVVALSFAVSTIASLGLVVLYVSGGQTQLEGLLLGAALGGLGLGIVLWATRLMPAEEEVEDRLALRDVKEEAALDAPEVTRRTLLVRLLGGAGVALGGALAIPALSLGPQPGASLFRTAWTAGARVVDANGSPIRPEDIPLEGVETVYPFGKVGSPDSQTLLVRVEPGLLQLSESAADGTVEGCVAYSKICTHAGCPVGLYRADAHELLCPCHQSTFDVLTGATPVFGPAARALPQLPLGLDAEGYLIAKGDFNEPVGPSFWNLTSGDDE